MKDLEIKHSTHKNPQVLTQLKCVKQEINKIYNEQHEVKMRFSRQKYYESGPKAMKLLSWRLRKQQTERTIYKIRNTRNKCATS